MALRVNEVLDAVAPTPRKRGAKPTTKYAHTPGPCLECGVDIFDPANRDETGNRVVHAPGCQTEAAARKRREELYDRLVSATDRAREKRAAKAALTNQEKEELMKKELRAKAEEMTAAELKDALKEAGVTGYSKMKHAELVEAYAEAYKPKPKPKKERAPREPRELSENQDRVPNPIEWSSDDGEYTGKSPSANWNGSRWQIGKYLYAQGHDKAEVREAFAKARAKLDEGAERVKVMNVTIRVMK